MERLPPLSPVRTTASRHVATSATGTEGGYRGLLPAATFREGLILIRTCRHDSSSMQQSTWGF